MADRLKRYRAKRDVARSPEPPGTDAGPGAGAAPRFVVQEHSATRLHWDLRLEHDGALASWALPNFLPDAAGHNLLAVRTEDHPVDYLAFEGEIPQGSYGAGTMRIFDRGTFDVLTWGPRKVEVELHGERLRGAWALFPIGRGDGASHEWMIHRMGAPLDPEAEPMPAALAPMLATAGTLPEGAQWAFEIKWDGVRVLCHATPGRLALRSRAGQDITGAYPELGAMTRALHEHRAILDGEIVAFDADGRPSFQALQRRMHVRDEARVRRLAREVPVTYAIFDLLWLDGRSLMGLPYDERRARLAGLELDGAHWQTPAATIGSGAELLEAASGLGLEGVVAKRRDGAYLPGRRSRGWVKVKLRASAELRIGGWLEGSGGRGGRIGALLVGEEEADGTLRYVGRVGSGLSDAELDDLGGRLAALARERSPFAPGGSRPPRGARWVEPALLAEVAYTERSTSGILRHPVWQGLRGAADAPLDVREIRRERGRGLTGTALVGGHEIALTNLDKVLYPQASFTKRQVVEYYATVAPVLTAHLRGRALTLVRHPDGVEGQSFFEKRVPAHAPQWVRSAEVRHGRETIRFVLGDDAATLVWLAQLAALELHPSLALASDAGRPTAVVFDLDPGAPATIVECCRVGLLLRGMLEGLGLRCLPKTSGSKGLQLYLPLNGAEATFEATKAFSRAVAEVLAAAEPDLVVATQAKTRRRGRVLVDWFQNDRSKTTIGVYSLRARPRPTVSTPVTWDEVEACAASGAPESLVFEAPQVLARVAAQGDLFGEVLTLVQHLPAL
ncbi:MAG TPA: DNA ligase D [Solirubrobacteraceae bacterium]